MKRLFIICLFIIGLCCPGYAGDTNPYVIGALNVAAGGVTCSGDWSDGGNEACEAASDGDMCTTDWTGVTDTSSILTTNSTDYANTGTKSVKVAMTAINQSAYTSVDTGALDGDWSIRFYLRTPSDLLENEGSKAYEVATGDETGPGSGERVFVYMLQDGVRAYSFDASSFIALSNSTWYRIELDYNRDTTSTLYVYTQGGSLVGSETFTARDNDVRYFDFGQNRGDPDIYATYYIDDIKYSSTGGIIGSQ